MDLMVITFGAHRAIIGAFDLHVVSPPSNVIKPDWRKPLPVLVRIDGHPKAKPWRINMIPTGTGAFYLYLHGSVRGASKTKVGDVVAVEIEFDSAYRGGVSIDPFSPWITDPQCGGQTARTALTPSRKKEIVRYLTALKSDAARERNLIRVPAYSEQSELWFAVLAVVTSRG